MIFFVNFWTTSYNLWRTLTKTHNHESDCQRSLKYIIKGAPHFTRAGIISCVVETLCVYVSKEPLASLLKAELIWPKYCRYGVKHYIINQSVNHELSYRLEGAIEEQKEHSCGGRICVWIWEKRLSSSWVLCSRGRA